MIPSAPIARPAPIYGAAIATPAATEFRPAATVVAPAVTAGPRNGSSCPALSILVRSIAIDPAPYDRAFASGAPYFCPFSAVFLTASRGAFTASWNTAKQEPGPVLGSVVNSVLKKATVGLVLPPFPRSRGSRLPGSLEPLRQR